MVITPAVPGQSEIAIGEKMTLNAVAYGKDGTIDDVAQDFIWTSSSDANASIARNEDGSATVTGLKAGTVTITATHHRRQRHPGRLITVKVIVPVEDFTIPETAQTTVGAEKALKLTVSPDGRHLRAKRRTLPGHAALKTSPPWMKAALSPA